MLKRKHVPYRKQAVLSLGVLSLGVLSLGCSDWSETQAATPPSAKAIKSSPADAPTKSKFPPDSTSAASAAAANPAGGAWTQNMAVAAGTMIKKHCVRCHGAPTANSKPAGEFRLDTLPAEPSADPERWSAVRDQLRDSLMPPEGEPRPKPSEVRALVSWITSQLGNEAPRLPNQGNLIPHELLFGPSADVATPPGTPARVWRLSPEGYMGWLREVYRGRAEQAGAVQPFTLVSERGIRDFAGLYSIDTPATEILIRNAAAIVNAQTAHVIKDGKVQGRNDSVREFLPFMDPTTPPNRKSLESALQTQFRMAIGRPATPEELSRFLALYDKCAASGDQVGAFKTVLQAVLLRTDALYRSELGAGAADGHGRRRLAPAELARALSLSLGFSRDSALIQAAEKGQLVTRDQIAAHVQRMLSEPKGQANIRMRQFFREYFEYHNAEDVFKDRPSGFVHSAAQLIADTDRLVAHILEQDRDVFRELLTTPLSFANYKLLENKQTRKLEIPAMGVKAPPYRPEKGQKPVANVESVYGLTEWPQQQPVKLPENTRVGILMQPAWLVAWSTNFENDPVRRGRWIRERLLGGTVPDLPIGVAAQVPDEPHRTFRDRLTVTRQAQCWKCHRYMDDLGLPFEQFDHYGRFRTAEPVLDREATAKALEAHQGKKGKAPDPIYRDAVLVTTGTIADSGDAKLDGPVRDPRELVRRLANSDRCRQVFIRHAFRFFLGRNETLSDARTLQEADRAYLETGGSFRALVVSLLTSDSFLYRLPIQPAAGTAATGAKRS